MRGVSAQQRSEYCTAHLGNLLAFNTYTYNVAPGINPSVPLPARGNRQTSGSVLRIFSPSSTPGNNDQQPSSVNATAEILPAADRFFWGIAPVPVNAPSLIMTSTSQHAIQPSELGLNPHGMGKVFL